MSPPISYSIGSSAVTIFVSPGISKNHKLIKKAIHKKIPISSDIELFWENKGFAMPVEVFYKSTTGFTEKRLALTNEPTMIALPQYNNIKIDPDKRVLLTLNKID